MNIYNKDFGERSSTSQDSNTQVDHSSPDRQTPSGSPSGSTTNWSSYQSSDYLRQLRDYSFGTAPRLSNSPSTYPITSQDDTEFEELMLRTDITPRPSVVAYHYQSAPRTSAWHHSSRGPVEQVVQHISASRQNWDGRGQGINIDSTPSSASASVTSFNESLYTGSMVSVDSSSTPQTPSNDFTSSEDDDERRRPYNTNFSGPYPNASANTSTTSMEFSSEEEYESDDIPDIEISSMRAASVDMSFQQEEDLDAEAYYLQGRRGSLPMDIPGALTTPGINTQYPFNRDRDDSFINLRRPSRSLDDDLHVIETSISRTNSDDPVLSSPISVPGSEGDWRNLNARVRQRGGARSDESQIPEGFEFPSNSGRSNQAQSTSGAHIVDDFDPDWDNLRQGIVSFDRSQLEDIIRQPGPDGNRTTTGPRWFRFGGGNSQSPVYARRQSVTTVGSDTFGRAVTRWGGEGYQAQRKDWSFKREKVAGVSQQSPGASASGNVGSRAFAGFLTSKTSEDDKKKAEKEREKEKGRLARVAASWKGMPIDSQEIWKMDLIGTFRVERRATKTADLAKGPQQRIIAHHLRGVDNSVASMIGGPMSTIHKHSKAVAFSIGRFHRKKTESKEKTRETGSGPLIMASHPPAPSADSQKRSGAMILLAPKRVQVAFTNTTSTRKLESHGLLDEDRSSRRTKEYELRSDRERERGKKKDKERNKKQEREKEKQKPPQRQGESKGKERALGAFQETRPVDVVNLSVTSRFTNASSGSDSYQTPSVITASTIVAPSVPLTPLSSRVDFKTQHTDNDTTSRSISTNLVTNRPHRRRRRIHDPLEMYEDEEEYDCDAGRHSPPTTTPHSETYGTVDASLIEQLNMERAQQELETGSVFKRLFRSRNNRATVGPATGQLEANYDPPWIVLPSRSKQEQQQRVVENLNSSFMDVGLLPSNHKMKKRSGSALRKKREEQPNGILSEVPEESLYMLLPLWPGETDPISIQDHLHLLKRIPPANIRQYILIYYRSTSLRKKGDKKNRSSPAIDADRTDRSILLTSFHISARFVAHNELIGTGVRVPDEGLTISGPLDYAWETLPSAEAREECKSDWVIGVCNSRESGVEFIPEGLIKMDLCRASWKSPNAVNDHFIPPEPPLRLTPIGRSVVEMAWLGAIALTSFGQIGQA